METLELTNPNSLKSLSAQSDESKGVVVISTKFNPHDKMNPKSPAVYELADNSVDLLRESVRILKFGGLLFVYGLPHQLAFWGQYLSELHNSEFKMLFKYWISLDIDPVEKGATLQPASLGLLMFLKTRSSSRTPSPFHLNTTIVRSAHVYCAACGENVKDWGGKKHLMDPKGTALSDVWRDLPKVRIKKHVIPEAVLDRVYDLTRGDGISHLHIVQNQPGINVHNKVTASPLISSSRSPNGWATLKKVQSDEVYEGDCISFLERVSALHPDGLFDLTFADPPYNLNKRYDNYEDELADQHYIEWCNSWLEGMVKTLKPGGSLFVLNLPKWAIHHAAFLNQRLEFRHWITWDALSDPRGKLMPSHYSLLYYTKPGAPPVFNYSQDLVSAQNQFVVPPDSPQYCLRASCVKRRKRLGDDKKVGLSDIWFDIHRIKHKRDRDAHPCQLPEKLMERIILLATNSDGLVFDPFCGAGTTALAARKTGRSFVTIDLDPNYVRITKEKLAAMEQHKDLFGVPRVPRRSVKKQKSEVSKKEIETYLQRLAQRLGKEPSVQDIEGDNTDMLRKIDLIYPTRLAAIKRCRVSLRASQ